MGMMVAMSLISGFSQKEIDELDPYQRANYEAVTGFAKKEFGDAYHDQIFDIDSEKVMPAIEQIMSMIKKGTYKKKKDAFWEYFWLEYDDTVA